MHGHQMTAAEPTELTMAQVRLIICRDVLRALDHLHRLGLPEGERIYRAAGPRPTRLTMAIAHCIGLACHSNLDSAAEAFPRLRSAHVSSRSLRRSVARFYSSATRIANCRQRVLQLPIVAVANGELPAFQMGLASHPVRDARCARAGSPRDGLNFPYLEGVFSEGPSIRWRSGATRGPGCTHYQS